MREWLFAFATIVIATCVGASAQDMSAIQKVHDAWADALNKKDMAAVEKLVAEDARIFPTNFKMIQGRDNIRAYWEKAAQPISDLKDTVTAVQYIGNDTAITNTVFTLKLNGQDVEGKAVMMWRRIGSDWKISTDIWNRTSPPLK